MFALCNSLFWTGLIPQIDGLVQERRNSSANALELRLSCINLLRCISWSSDHEILQMWCQRPPMFALCNSLFWTGLIPQIDGLVQERRNSSVLALELRLSCINLLRCISWSSDHEILQMWCQRPPMFALRNSLFWTGLIPQIDGLVQERRNSSALALELRLSCINLLRCISWSSDHEILQMWCQRPPMFGLCSSLF